MVVVGGDASFIHTAGRTHAIIVSRAFERWLQFDCIRPAGPDKKKARRLLGLQSVGGSWSHPPTTRALCRPGWGGPLSSTPTFRAVADGASLHGIMRSTYSTLLVTIQHTPIYSAPGKRRRPCEFRGIHGFPLPTHPLGISIYRRMHAHPERSAVPASRRRSEKPARPRNAGLRNTLTTASVAAVYRPKPPGTLSLVSSRLEPNPVSQVKTKSLSLPAVGREPGFLQPCQG